LGRPQTARRTQRRKETHERLPATSALLGGRNLRQGQALSGKPRQSKAIRLPGLADWTRQGPAKPDTGLAGSPGNQRQRPAASGKKPTPGVYLARRSRNHK